MKKFLSLVLALVMTMSLVTVSASATEYKDLTDKDEITYEEAVTVLNKLGIITGYTDGSFNPTGALTRGAAAKIIVSLMIGSEAASNLSVTTAPYTDVPVDNTFAAVISYCKTAGYINGYGDGTFRPSATLTGYAFAKMLLGALGYDGAVEGFTGNGWTMNVARIGNEAGLYRDFVDAFKGNDGVTREQACQLALNTIKATQVEYTGGTSITTSAGDATTSVVTNKVRSYKTSNDGKINQNISDKKTNNDSEYYTLEFGEEHFSDLKLTTYLTDDYGRPANTWSLKNIEIGRYAQAADFTFTAKASGDTDVDKVKDMGLKDLRIVAGYTTLTVNGESLGYITGVNTKDNTYYLTDGKTTLASNAAILTNYVQNGTLVQIYLNDSDANLIDYIAVTETQIMKIDTVSSSTVTLKTVEDQGIKNVAMNDGSEVKSAVAVNAVKSDDECFAALSALKSGDFVVVTPLKNGSTWDVDAVYVPTTASGSISDVKVNAADKNTSALTVDGTTYNMSRNWTAEDADGNRTSVLNSTSVTTKQDSTVYIDSYGYAIYVANVQATTSFFLFDEVSSQTVGSKIHYIAEGWDTKGNAVSLDFGTQNPDLDAGTVYAYKTAASNSAADYAIDWAKTSDQVISGTGSFTADQTKIGGVYFASGVKFIFPSWENGDITGVTVRSGSQNLSSTKYQYVLDKASDSDSNKITAVFLSSDKDVEVSTNVLYVQKQTWATANDDAKVVSKFTGYINGEKVVDASANKRVTDNTFYTYSYNESTGIYTVNAYTSSSGKTTSVLTNAWFNNEDLNKGKKAYLDGGSTVVTEDNDYLTTSLNLANATVIDLRDGGTLASASNMAEADYTAYKVSLVYNDSSSSSERGRVSYVFILGTDTVTHDATTKYTVTAPTGTLVSADGTTWGTTARILGDIGTKFYLKADGDYMFSDDPDLDNIKLDGSTATYEGDGVYSVALKALVSTQADADALTGSSVIANTHVVKLTASHFEFISGTPTLYLQFHDNTDTLDDGSSYGNLANIAREVMVKEGYTNAYIDGSGDVEFISGGQLYTLTILAKNTIVFKVDGVTEFADGSSAPNMGAIDHASKYTGTYWKDKSDGSYKPVSSTAVADGEEYESGYYKVTQPTTDTIADVTYTVTDSADATHYVHKDGSFTVTVTLSGAASAATKATFTVTHGNIVESTLSASSGTAAGETVAVTTSNTKVEITPVNGNTSTAVYTFTVKPDGVGDVSVALA